MASKKTVGVPQGAESINGSHVLVTPPAMKHTYYYSRKGWYSVLVQVAGDNVLPLQNLHVYVGWPGSIHDTSK